MKPCCHLLCKLCFIVTSDDGGNVNAQNGDGVTPLHDAVQRKDPQIVRLLVNNNADPTLAAYSG